jgi:plasmid segregation protein ParM
MNNGQSDQNRYVLQTIPKGYDMMFIFGGDIGFKQFKGINLNHDIQFKFQNIIGFPSPLEITQRGQDTNQMLEDLSIKFEDELYYVGAKAMNEATNHRYTFLANKIDKVDETIKLLTALGILSCHGVNTIDVMVTGAPVEEYHLTKDKIQKDFVRSYQYEFRGEKHRSTIKEVMVIPQGAGDYYDYILTDAGELIQEKISPKSVIINIGYRTTEIVTMNYGRFSRSESTTLYTATNSFHKELRRLLAKEYGIRKNLTQIDDIYRSGKVFIKGNEIDITLLKEKAIRHHIGSIIGEIPMWVNTDDIYSILLSGGGSVGLCSFFQEEFGGRISILKKPEFGNARGNYKYGRLMVNARTTSKAFEEV